MNEHRAARFAPLAAHFVHGDEVTVVRDEVVFRGHGGVVRRGAKGIIDWPERRPGYFDSRFLLLVPVRITRSRWRVWIDADALDHSDAVPSDLQAAHFDTLLVSLYEKVAPMLEPSRRDRVGAMKAVIEHLWLTQAPETGDTATLRRVARHLYDEGVFPFTT